MGDGNAPHHLQRKEEVPILPISQDCHRNAPVEGVLEELAIDPFALSNLLYLNQDNRITWWICPDELAELHW